MTKRILSGMFLIILCGAGIFSSMLLWHRADAGIFIQTGILAGYILIGCISPDLLRLSAVMAIVPAARIVSITLSPQNGQIQTVILTITLFALGLSYTLRTGHNFFLRPNRLQFASALGIGIVAAGFGLIAASLNPNFSAGGQTWLSMAITLALLSITCELVLRSALLGELIRQFHPALAMLMCILTEASLYTNGSSVQYFTVCIAGTVASYIYLREGTLWHTILFSFLWRFTYYYIYAAGIIPMPVASPI